MSYYTYNASHTSDTRDHVHSDHMHIEVRDGAGLTKTTMTATGGGGGAWGGSGGAWGGGAGATVMEWYEVAAEICAWCGFKTPIRTDLGVAYFPSDEAIHCINTDRCRRRLMFRLGLLLGEVLYVKLERSDKFLSALLPEEL